VQERRDFVTIALSRGNISISWDARQALLTRLQHVQSTSRIRASFHAVAAARPVELNPGQKLALVKMLEEWWDEGSGMPIELAALHDALQDDVADLA
jgi:hypothetical protein